LYFLFAAIEAPDSKVEVVLNGLKDFESLTELHINGFELDRNRAPLLAQTIASLPKLKSLDLGNNMLLPEDFHQVLMATPLLEELCIDKNILTEVS